MTKKKINLRILLPVFFMALISIVTIYSALTYTSKSLGNLALKQTIWYLIGSVLVMVVLKLKNNYFYNYARILYILGNISLVLLLFFGLR